MQNTSRLYTHRHARTHEHMDWKSKQAKINANAFVTVQTVSGSELRLCIGRRAGFT